MFHPLKRWLQRRRQPVPLAAADDAPAAHPQPTESDAPGRRDWGRVVLRVTPLAAAAAVVVLGAAWLQRHPPVQTLAAGEVGLRTHLYTGETTRWREGGVWVLPGVHALRRVPLSDQVWRAEALARADGASPAQSVEGLSLGLDLSVRWAVDPAQLGRRPLPPDLAADIVAPAVQGVVYPILARHTVREIFSTKREAIQQAIADALKGPLAAEGIVLKAVHVGNIDLPADYRRGLDSLLAEGLATEKMRYTLELKDKRVRETELDASAEKVRRELAAEAAAREQVIAARAQEEAMKHVLPLKQRQIEQRKLEAEAERQSRVRRAEGMAEARRIEAQAEADARLKLADAEAYRAARMGRVQAEQMAAEGALITRHPLLIQKALADRLSDKIQVIIAPPSESGGFIAAGLLGRAASPAAPAPNGDEMLAANPRGDRDGQDEEQ
jgi:regulator of protease activity HflC (stomatin/prohibitin superfamily)